jgi:hypothetical protein
MNEKRLTVLTSSHQQFDLLSTLLLLFHRLSSEFGSKRKNLGVDPTNAQKLKQQQAEAARALEIKEAFESRRDLVGKGGSPPQLNKRSRTLVRIENGECSKEESFVYEGRLLTINSCSSSSVVRVCRCRRHIAIATILYHIYSTTW